MFKAPAPPSFVALSTTTTYDAKLLLLSVRNVDKSLKKGDATYEQRLEMIELLAKEIIEEDEGENRNVAIAIIDEPTFVGKSSVLLEFLGSLSDVLGPRITPHLNFLLGFDTLERLFSPQYYTTGNGTKTPQENMNESLRSFFEVSRVVCARRVMEGAGKTPELKEKETLEAAERWIKGNRIALIDIGEDEQPFSSSAVREGVRREGMGGKGWRGLVSPAIEAYIVQSGLYRDES